MGQTESALGRCASFHFNRKDVEQVDDPVRDIHDDFVGDRLFQRRFFHLLRVKSGGRCEHGKGNERGGYNFFHDSSRIGCINVFIIIFY
ncbi:hypothetical protein SDC9_200485 [bioreactor metagenome]|uniref:Uncharacterized protein n=1 Tax=bioreactor metagenome TaxID=1076179 RepID=A0A645IPL6_9ZZZZ